MLNENIKNEFITITERSSILSDNYIQNVFNKASVFEDRFEKDCCNFTQTEIINMLSGFYSSSVDTLVVVRSLLDRYTNYCITKGISIDGISHYSFITLEELSRCIVKKDTYVSPKEIINQLLKLEDNCDRFLWYGIYKGLTYEELVGVTIDDVSENILKYNGKVIKDERLCQLARAAHNAEFMISTNSRNNVFMKSPKILRPLMNAKDVDDIKRGIKRVTFQYKRCKEIIEYQGNITSLRMSGFFNSVDAEGKSEDEIADLIKNNKELLTQYNYNKDRYCIVKDYKKYYIEQQ